MPIESEGIDSLYTLRNLGATGLKDLDRYLAALNPGVVGFTNTDLIALRDKLLLVYPIGGTQAVVSNNQSVPVSTSALAPVAGSNVIAVASGVPSVILDSSTGVLRNGVQVNVSVVNNLSVVIGSKCVPTVVAGVITSLQILV